MLNDAPCHHLMSSLKSFYYGTLSFASDVFVACHPLNHWTWMSRISNFLMHCPIQNLSQSRNQSRSQNQSHCCC